MITLVIAVPVFIYSIFKNVSFNDFRSGKDFVIDSFSAGNITGIVILALVVVLLFGFLKVIEFILIIYGSVKSSSGEVYKYPMTINFIK